MAAIKAGKHVLIEKPLARNAIEGEELVKAAKDAGVVLADAVHRAPWLHQPAYRPPSSSASSKQHHYQLPEKPPFVQEQQSQQFVLSQQPDLTTSHRP